MRMEDLRWDGTENACTSLRILAELVRRGDATCLRITGSGQAATIRLEMPSKGRISKS